jgi:hypothetical protein
VNAAADVLLRGCTALGTRHAQVPAAGFVLDDRRTTLIECRAVGSARDVWFIGENPAPPTLVLGRDDEAVEDA